MNLAIRILLVDAVVIGGCASPPATPAEVATALLDASCTKAHACQASFPGDRRDFEDAFGTTPAACAARPHPEVLYLDAAVDSDRVRFDAEAGDACVAAIAAASCGDFWDGTLPPACAATFRGQIPSGGACAFDIECAAGICAQATSTCAP